MEKQKLNTLYKCRCNEVTLDEFIDCLLNENYRRLIKSQTIESTPEEVAETDRMAQEAWGLLYSEYAVLSDNKQHVYYFNLYKAIYSTRLKLLVAQAVLGSPEFVEKLVQFGYKGDISQIISKVKQDTIALQTKEKELKKQVDKQPETALNESYFDDWIISVGKYLGYQIRRKEMSLTEFLAANKAMTKEYEAMRKRLKK
jgi:hypothetical protein